jgi:Cas7 group CRISPR-associated protein Csh2
VKNAKELKELNRATLLLVVEAVNSGINQDPDNESDPRTQPDGRGLCTPVSFKAKLRTLVADKEFNLWKELSKNLSLADKEFDVLERRDTVLKEIFDMTPEAFKSKYWDARLFGNTALEGKDSGGEKAEKDRFVRTGVVQFGLGVSVCPVDIIRLTTTGQRAVQAGKSRAMAALGYRVVKHGLYVMPGYVNPAVASKSGCTATDVELMKRVIPYAYSHTTSYVRSEINILHAWYVEHKSPLGSCPDWKIIEALTPKRIGDPETPSQSRKDYEIPSALPEELRKQVKSAVDLMEYMAQATDAK